MGVHLFSKKLDNSYIFKISLLPFCLTYVPLYKSRARRTISVTDKSPPATFMDPLSAVEDILGHVEFWPSTVIVDLFVSTPCTNSIINVAAFFMVTMFLWKKPWTVSLRVLE